jgi:hypothetical protein
MKAPQVTQGGRVRPQIWMVVIVVLAALRPLSWLVLEWRHCPGGVCAASGTPPEWDFAIFWIGGRLAGLRDFSDIFVFANFHVYVLTHFHYDIGLSPFAYPPPVLLLFRPLALLPLPAAYALWVAGGTAALLAALRLVGLRWSGCVFVLLSPPFLYNLLLGQNGAFTAALLISALHLAARRPRTSGVLAALLAIKPQIALLIPAAWAGARRWRALAASVLAGAALILVSVLAFGFAPWRLYVHDTLPDMASVMNAPFPQDFQASAMTVFVLARSVGASVIMARVIQAMALLAAALTALRLWRDDFGAARQLALTLLLVLLAMPYGYVYDMIPYAAALALVLQCHGVSWRWAVFWIWPAFARDVTYHLAAPVTAIVVLAAFIWVLNLKLEVPPARPA